MTGKIKAPAKMRHPYIVAGTHKQAMDWIRENGYRVGDCTIIGRPELLQGRAFPSGALVYVGSWLDRTDLAEVQREIDAATSRHAVRVSP